MQPVCNYLFSNTAPTILLFLWPKQWSLAERLHYPHWQMDSEFSLNWRPWNSHLCPCPWLVNLLGWSCPVWLCAHSSSCRSLLKWCLLTAIFPNPYPIYIFPLIAYFIFIVQIIDCLPSIYKYFPASSTWMPITRGSNFVLLTNILPWACHSIDPQDMFAKHMDFLFQGGLTLLHGK